MSPPAKTVYNRGEILDTKGLELSASYSDGASEKVTSGYTCSPTLLMPADGASHTMDIAPYINNSRTLLPLRFVAETLGCQVEWIGSVHRVIIVYTLQTDEKPDLFIEVRIFEDENYVPPGFSSGEIGKINIQD
jgi:hypothetical protein